MGNWRRLHGEDQVNLGVTTLANYVASHWQPSWYSHAGILLPDLEQKTNGVRSTTTSSKHGIDTSHGVNTSNGNVTVEAVTGLGLSLRQPDQPSPHAPTTPAYAGEDAILTRSDRTENAHTSKRPSPAGSQPASPRADDLLESQPSTVPNEVAGSDNAITTLQPVTLSAPSADRGKELHHPSTSVPTTRSPSARPTRTTRDRAIELQNVHAASQARVTRVTGAKPAARTQLRKLPSRKVKNVKKIQLRVRPARNAKGAAKVGQKGNEGGVGLGEKAGNAERAAGANTEVMPPVEGKDILSSSQRSSPNCIDSPSPEKYGYLQ